MNEQVSINGRALSGAEVAGLAVAYQVSPRPGEYWYDPRSGLYGALGGPAAGVMMPGHDFGPVARGASGGDTGVLVNGRELPAAEWTGWGGILGHSIPPGSWWLDAGGNLGADGCPLPVANVRASRSSSGDGFWSTRFGAGNYDPSSGAGYVSVPGHGPVGFGM